MRKPAELRALTLKELREEELSLRKELFNLRVQRATGEISNPRRIRQVRREIARVLTIMSEKAKGQ